MNHLELCILSPSLSPKDGMYACMQAWCQGVHVFGKRQRERQSDGQRDRETHDTQTRAGGQQKTGYKTCHATVETEFFRCLLPPPIDEASCLSEYL